MGTCKECGGSPLATRSRLCKPCHNAYTRQHYLDNKQKYLDKAYRRKTMIRELVRVEKDKPCMDCNISYPPFVMDFDHREDKEFDISRGYLTGNITKIMKEIEKCDLVCANCHRIRTHARQQASVIALPSKQ